jgi:hemerythrin-like metal-binding protein
MPLVTWSDQWKIGNTLIDNQHKRLVSLMNELNDAMVAGKGNDALEKILRALVTYTQTHFADEEKLMVRLNYKDYPRHLAIHREFTTTIKGFHEKYRSGNSHLTVQLLVTLKDWLVNHIKNEDQKIG